MLAVGCLMMHDVVAWTIQQNVLAYEVQQNVVVVVVGVGSGDVDLLLAVGVGGGLCHVGIVGIVVVDRALFHPLRRLQHRHSSLHLGTGIGVVLVSWLRLAEIPFVLGCLTKHVTQPHALVNTTLVHTTLNL
jgi:hypothetical protein